MPTWAYTVLFLLSATQYLAYTTLRISSFALAAKKLKAKVFTQLQ